MRACVCSNSATHSASSIFAKLGSVCVFVTADTPCDVAKSNPRCDKHVCSTCGAQCVVEQGGRGDGGWKNRGEVRILRNCWLGESEQARWRWVAMTLSMERILLMGATFGYNYTDKLSCVPSDKNTWKGLTSPRVLYFLTAPVEDPVDLIKTTVNIKKPQ